MSKSWLNADEFDRWVEAYDRYELKYIDIKLPQNIDTIYVSTQNRALRSVLYITEKFQRSELLVEVRPESFIKTQIKLPKIVWLIISRILWYFNLSKGENRADTIQRAEAFIERVDLEQNSLIITHGFFMKVLVQRLRLRGYKGKIDRRATNGKLYHLNLH